MVFYYKIVAIFPPTTYQLSAAGGGIAGAARVAGGAGGGIKMDGRKLYSKVLLVVYGYIIFWSCQKFPTY